MKASLKLRDEQKPLFRAKVPLNILGFPFQSGVAAGDSKELSLNLSTFFESGPSLKLVYRPNDSWNPFSLVVKTGIGAFGSPNSAPLSMSAEFNLVGGNAATRGSPSFFIQFRPQIGDFSIKKSSSSPITISSLPIKPVIQDSHTDPDSDVDGGDTPLDNGVHSNGNLNNSGLFGNKRVTALTTAGSNAVSKIDGFINGVEVSARTVLPVRNRAVLKCRWGVKLPSSEEIKDPRVGIAFGKIPFLVMNKIAIEHVAAEDDTKKEVAAKRDPQGFGGNADVVEACLGVKRQLEGLQMENGLLKKAMEELRSEIGGGKSEPFSSGSSWYRNGGKYMSGKNERKGSELGGEGDEEPKKA